MHVCKYLDTCTYIIFIYTCAYVLQNIRPQLILHQLINSTSLLSKSDKIFRDREKILCSNVGLLSWLVERWLKALDSDCNHME